MAHNEARQSYTWTLSCWCSLHSAQRNKRLAMLGAMLAADRVRPAAIVERPTLEATLGGEKGRPPPGPKRAVSDGDIAVANYAWKPRSTLRFAFRTGSPRRQEEVVRAAIERWQRVLKTGLTLKIVDRVDVSTESDVDFLIEFLPSEVGHEPGTPRTRTSRGIEAIEHKYRFFHPDIEYWKGVEVPDAVWPNMVFGIDLCSPWGYATALHEVGHALGLGHEHQRAAVRTYATTGIYTDRILRHFRYQENWPEIVAKKNVEEIDPYDGNYHVWDPYSIMHYPFPCHVINTRGLYHSGTPRNFDLSRGDITNIRSIYPP